MWGPLGPGDGEWETMVAGGAHHDEDLPLVDEDLVPLLNLRLPKGCSRLNVEAVLGEEGHESEEVAVRL